jgi:hypothetical protein
MAITSAVQQALAPLTARLDALECLSMPPPPPQQPMPRIDQPPNPISRDGRHKDANNHLQEQLITPDFTNVEDVKVQQDLVLDMSKSGSGKT